MLGAWRDLLTGGGETDIELCCLGKLPICGVALGFKWGSRLARVIQIRLERVGGLAAQFREHK